MGEKSGEKRGTDHGFHFHLLAKTAKSEVASGKTLRKQDNGGLALIPL
jgi:hypothetical protein